MTWDTIRETTAVLVAAVVAGVTAWRVRGKRDQISSADITRKEWQDVANLAKIIPGHARRIRFLEVEMRELRSTVTDRLDLLTRLDADFRSHTERWEEVGLRAVEDRRDMKEDLNRLESKLDDFIRDLRQRT